MRLEYWTVTSVFKDDEKWAQLCHCKWILTLAEYQNCEIIMPRGISSLPKVWDVVLLSEIANAEIVVLWVLEQFDLWLSEWEVMLHWWPVIQNWQNSSYQARAFVKLNKDNEIVLQTFDSTGSSKVKVVIQQDWQIVFDCGSKVTIKSTSDIELNAPTVHIV